MARTSISRHVGLAAAALAAAAAATVAAAAPNFSITRRRFVGDGNGPQLQLYNCSDVPAISQFQVWNYSSSALTIQLVSNGNCIDIEDYGTDDGSVVWTYTCHTSDKTPSHQNQEWLINSNGTITSTMSGKCMEVESGWNLPGSVIDLNECTGASSQLWNFDQATGRIVGVGSGLCLDGGTPLTPCDIAPTNGYAFCNTSLPITARVADIVNRMQLDEKYGMFNTGGTGAPSINIAAYQWWSEALHGVAYSPGVTFNSLVPGATSFPQVCTTSMALNTTLWNAIGAVVSTEARAMNNVGQAGNTFCE